MYAWKCWRDTRGLFIVLALGAVLVMPVAAVVCAGTGFIHDFGLTAFQATFSLIGFCAALTLGAQVASQSFASDALQFLFTKPRSRSYFLWTSWAIGGLEALTVVAGNFAAGYITLVRQHVNPLHGPAFSSHQVAGNLVGFALDYCLVYSLTVVLGGELKGVGVSMAIMLGLPAIGALVRLRWQFDLPINRIPFAVMTLGSLALASLLVISAQVFVQRIEL